MEKTLKWKDLRDGSRLHAAHLFELADAAREATASAIAGAGASGRFINVNASSEQTVNSILLDNDNRILDIDNLLLLTPGGFLAELPPPRKSFAVPPDGDNRYLNLYARSFADGGGKTDANWEQAAANHARGVCLAEWSADQGIRLLPLPFTLGALAQANELRAELAEAATALVALLASGDPRVHKQLRLNAQTQHFLGPLLTALECSAALAPTTPLDAAVPHLAALAVELRSWFCFLAVATQGGPNAMLAPDPIVRRAAAARGTVGLADYVAALGISPKTGSELLLWMDALARGTVGITRTIMGERDEDPLEPIEIFEPDPWPDGSGFKFRLPAGAPINLRCEVLFDLEPQLMWGTGPADILPQLRALPLEHPEPGRFETTIGPFTLGADEELVLVVDDAAAGLRVYQQR